MARTLIASAVVVVLGLVAIGQATLGLRALTLETARRIEVRENPRPLPSFRIQLQDGRVVETGDLRGKVVLATFMYTSCPGVCPLMAGYMASLRNRFRGAAEADALQLLSISFDPARDTPERLAGFASNFQAVTEHWWVARPVEARATLLDRFDVTAIRLDNGIWAHNAAFYLIDREQRLVEILDDRDMAAVRTALARELQMVPGGTP